jgi:predicted ribosome quality control (RQC) complex YloA/Tae2 family protein
MRYELLTSVVTELATLLPGMRVKRVFQGAKGIHLILHRTNRDFVLLISPDRTMPRLHLVKKKPEAMTSPHPMVLYLRSHLSGATVRAVAMVNNDRVVEILLSCRGIEFRLMFELTGSAANLVLIDAVSVIKAVYFSVPETGAPKRPLLAGLTYVPPCAREPRPVTALYQDESTSASLGGPFSPASVDDTAANRAAEAFFEERISSGQLEAERKELSRTVTKNLSRIVRRSEALSADLAVSSRAEEFRKTGDLILANLACLERGQEQAALADYEGAVMSVRLDPRCSPIQNAEQYFKKYKKAKSGRTIVLARLTRAREEAESLQYLQAAVAAAPDADTLARLRAEMSERGCLKALQGTVKQGRTGDSLPYRRTVFCGWEIFIGRSAAGNDYLSTKLARPGDRWLHAEGMPGSHVLVRNPGGAPVPAEVLMKAASYAAFYSKGRGAGKVSVTHTEAGKVSKPKGAKPGMVVLSERQSFMAIPEELS